MEKLNYSEAREKLLAQTMDRVCNEHAPTVITRRDGPAVVLLSLEDYEALTHAPLSPPPVENTASL